MNILSRTEFRRSALLLALILIAGCLLIPGALAVTVSTGTFQINTVGNTTTIPIVLDTAPNALSGYKIQISLTNPTVGTITDCSFPSWQGLKTKSTLPNASIVISGLDTEAFVKAGDTNILLATLTVQGSAVGSTPITITVSPPTYKIQDTLGNNYAVTTPAGQLTVGTPVTTVPTTIPTTNVTTTVPTTIPTTNVTTTVPTTAPTTVPTTAPTTTVPTTTVTPGTVSADFQVVTTPGSNLVLITDKSVNAATVRYDLGDGASTKNMAAHGPTLSYYYVTANTYTITQTATSAGGQTATKQISVTVGGAPTITTTPVTTVTTTVTTVTPTPTVTVTPGSPLPDFILTNPSPMGIQIIDSSVGATSVTYNLGDGTTTHLTQFRYTYWQAGTYTITLTATNAVGSSVKTVQLTVPVTGPTTTTTTPVVTTTTTATTATPTTTVAPGQPFNGPHTIPGTVQAEDYDLGGQNVAYMDTTAGNAGGAYRTDDVDIENGATGKDVGYVISGEYLTYSVDAATAGDYAITLNAANPDATTKTVTISAGSSSTTVSVPSTGSFDTFNTFSSAPSVVHFVQGRNIVKVAFGASRMNLDYITIGPIQPTPTVTTTVTTTTTTAQPTPTVTTTVQPTGTPLSTPYYIIAQVPGHIESYSYDNGGEGVAYHDTTTANLGGKLRSDAVDIEYSQADAGYNVGYVVSGEWLIYSIQVNTAGTYTVAIRASNPDSTAKHIVLTLEGSATPIGTVTVPSTGSFDKYTTITTTVQLPAGRHWLKLSFPENRMNFRFMDFSRGASTGVPDLGVTTAVATTPMETTQAVISTPAEAENNTTVKV